MTDVELHTAGERLRWARQHAGYKTAKAAAKAARIGEVSFRAYENDQHGFSKHATKLSKAFGVPVDWLMDGGPLPQGEPPKIGEVSTPDDLADKYEIELIRQVDISYAMGDGSFVEDYPDAEFIPFNLNFLRRFIRGATDRVFIATGHGDSMEPTLRRDDLVMIDTAQNQITLQDQIWALTYAGAGMIKRVRRLPEDRYLIMSDNPHVPPQEAEVAELHVVGKVVWSARVL